MTHTSLLDEVRPFTSHVRGDEDDAFPGSRDAADGTAQRPWGETQLIRNYVTTPVVPQRAPKRRRTFRPALWAVAAAAVAVTATVTVVAWPDSTTASAASPQGGGTAIPSPAPETGRPSVPPTPDQGLGGPSALGGGTLIGDGEAEREITESLEEQADAQAGAAEAAAVAQEAAERRTAERQEARAAQQRLLEERLAADKARQERAERKRPAPGAPATAGSVVLPLADVKLSARFGDKGELWSSGEHTGLDFVAPTGTELMAVHDATVTRVTSGGALGNHTVLRLEDGTEVRYSHQDSVAVEEGQKVKAGEVIGAVGDTGNTTGPHLHLEVVDAAGNFIDPEAWFAEQGLSL